MKTLRKLLCSVTLAALSLYAGALPSNGTLTVLGKTQVTTPGTPVAVLNQFTYTGKVTAKSVQIQALGANTGKVYVVLGSTAADLTGFTNVVAELAPGTSVTITQNDIGVSVENLYIDAVSANDKAIATIQNWHN